MRGRSGRRRVKEREKKREEWMVAPYEKIKMKKTFVFLYVYICLLIYIYI